MLNSLDSVQESSFVYSCLVLLDYFLFRTILFRLICKSPNLLDHSMKPGAVVGSHCYKGIHILVLSSWVVILRDNLKALFICLVLSVIKSCFVS